MISEADIKTFATALPRLRVLVVGDLMLDRYHFGRVTRISPEAPVPVVDVERTESRPGGAANVALNIRSMGAQVALCGLIGNDDNGKILMNCLGGEGFDTSLVTIADDRPTTTKTRIIGNNQQILRVDHESRKGIDPALQAQILQSLEGRLEGFDAIVLEDYDKGLLSEELIQNIVFQANAAGLPIAVDPKFRNFLSYKGVTLFKPNLKELNEALGLSVQKQDLEGIAAAAMQLRQRMPHHETVVTLSENGVLSIDTFGTPTHIPAHFRKITDVSGAGDTVIAILALALAARLPLATAASIANLAGGLVCEEVGVVTIDRERLFAEMQAMR